MPSLILRRLRAVTVLLVILLLSGCALIYRQDVQQGSVIDQEMVDQLKPGMSKRQVELILGSPAHQSPFHASRWDYFFSAKNGRTGAVTVKSMSLYFEGDRLGRIEGDYKPAAPAES